MSHDPAIGRPANRLAREKSPYLLQHARNPVDWYPWGDEAFAKARSEDKPIFLSIGYSTCHWCHVMERESFENDEVAQLLNEGFVPVKVDREERPDVDRIYMTAMQALGMGGGWPLNVFLTPALRPFFGGTYFPPRALHGRIGMIELLPRVREAWAGQREQVERTGDEVVRALASLDERGASVPRYGDLADGAFATLERLHDSEHGGFGNAPKFPSTVNLNFLQRVGAREPERREAALAMITRQLDVMAAGGIHDHLGGGFHRYATDAHWLVPHFEKMLYDQALLAWAYLEGFQVTGNPRYAEVARGIFDYVARDLSAPDGGFLSAEDADSEGEEGRFYVWTPADVERLLESKDAKLFADRYGVSARGNFEHAATVLSEVHTIDEVAERHGLAPQDVRSRLEAARATLLAHRGTRVRPHRDDKVLTAWNGLMISAFARGSRVLGDAALAERAARAGAFAWERLRDGDGRLLRRWRDGEAAGAAQLDDHAYLALGFVDLLQATGDVVWLERAAALTEAMLARFWDERDGACFESPGDDPSIAVRMKDGFDGAEMAGNSIAAYNLRLLGALLDRREWVEKARRACDYYAARLDGQPVAMPQMLVAMDLMETTPRHVVVAGRPDAADTRALVNAFDRRFLPHDVRLPADGGDGQRRLAALTPFVAPLVPREGRATAYVCVEGACRLPVTEPEAFAEQLEAGV